MKRLFEIELIKLRNSRPTKVVLIIYAAVTIIGLLMFGSAFVEAQSKTGDSMESLLLFDFPVIWFTGALVSTYLVFFPAILSILHTGNEFSSKIHRQHIIDGLSKDEYIISKIFSILIITLACTLYTAFLCIVIGLLSNSTPYPQDEIDHIRMLFGGTPPILWIIGYFIYTFSILSFALLVTFIFRKAGRSIFVFISYFAVFEWILRWILESSILVKFLPIWSVANNIFPNITETATKVYDKNFQEADLENWWAFDWSATFLAIVYIAIYILIIRWLFLKRDL